MRKYLLFLILVVCGSTQGFAQKIKTDIFDNLIYESKDRDYKASFKENIFNDLIFSDNKGNEITFKNKYIEFEYQKLLADKEAKLDLFISMIHAHSQDRNYVATYSVDIFDIIIIEDNRNRKVEIGMKVDSLDAIPEGMMGREVTGGKHRGNRTKIRDLILR